MNFQNPIKVSSKNTFNDIKNENPQKYKTILCKHFSSPGGCILGNQCKFAHGLAELRHPNKNQGLKKEGIVLENYKIIKCKYWEKNHSCKFGKLCTFAHGKKDLRTKDNNIKEAMKNHLYNNYGEITNNYNNNLYTVNQTFFHSLIQSQHSFLNNNINMNNFQNLYNENGFNDNNNYNLNKNETYKSEIEQDKNVKVFNINNGLFNFPIQ